MKTFTELGVSEPILRAIADMGFENPMPIQEEVIPYLLGNGNDVIALAQTGTGKTAAFGIPLLQRTDTQTKTTQAVILSPTRELCLQIADDLKDFSKYIDGVRVLAVYGGTSIQNQIRAIERGVQIIVATPGRLIDLMKRGVAKLDGVRNVVLDEADEMLNMGFKDDIDEILAGVPADRNTLLFSATMSKDIERIARTYLHDHKEIVVGSRNEGAENVNHIYYMVQARDKYLALKRIVDYYPRIFAIVFCRTKAETQEVADKLIRDGYSAESLHGDLSQQQRDLTMQKFRQHLTQLLVATDVAARGLDVDDLTHVINFGLPDDIENYTHRSGRTGRAGKKGTSIAIVHSRERHKIRNIEREIGKKFVEGTIPSSKEICTKQLYKVMEQIDKVDVKEEEIAPFMEDINRRFDYMDKEELLKKIVSMEFGKFLAYYADAPEILQISAKDDKKKSASDKPKGKGGGARKAEKGYVKLFINLGKTDGFYPGEIMQFINKHVGGRQRVGHIDLLQRFSYIEVPERDARKVMDALDGTTYKKRAVRCNRSDETDPSKREKRGDRKEKPARRDNKGKKKEKKQHDEMPKEENNYDWRQFFRNDDIKLKGEEPDFSEDGWARRKPKKK
ncbi:MAG: DEAD/DEAH box helicase [Prevotella sp.]|nr:DEAD/DEAH box helicase [Prevotella sp.]